MKAVIDTSSLVSLVRYYLPFDKDGKLTRFLEERLLAREVIVMEEVALECKRVSKGLVVKAFPFIVLPKYKTIATDIRINKALYNLIDNNFVIGSIKTQLPEAEYQLERSKFTSSGDFAMVLYAYSLKEKEDVFIVTEETGYSNDCKPFKKIPDICNIIGVKTLNLPSFLKENGIIDLTVEVQKTSLF